jgi:pilus assembly protein CpaB
MWRRVIAAAIGVVLAAAGTLALTTYVRGAESRALAGEQVVPVLIVREAVAQGTPVEALGNRVEETQVPAKVRADGTVDSLDGLEGRVAAVDLVPGEQVLAQRFVDPQALVEGQVEVPEGLLQVTVKLDSERALGGALRAGDLVGVIASLTDFGGTGEEESGGPASHLILHKVLVSRVQGGATTEEDGGALTPTPSTGELLITLAVGPGAAERVVFAAEHGSLWLTSQPDNAREDGVRVQTRETIYE